MPTHKPTAATAPRSSASPTRITAPRTPSLLLAPQRSSSSPTRITTPSLLLTPQRSASPPTRTTTPRTPSSPWRAALLAPLVLLACLPELDADLALVDAPRILAVAAEPAEVGPNKLATFTALYADHDGAITVAELDWALCTARRPLAELGPVDPACLAASSKQQVELPRGLSVLGKIPQDACRLYGPDPPPAAPGEPSGRPVDPDATGGYYQPLRVFDPDAPDDPTLLRVRLACGLAGATQQQAAEYRRRYLANLAPAVTLEQGEAVLADSLKVAPSAELPLRARWSACTPACGDAACTPGEPTDCPADCEAAAGCDGAETYLRFDPVSLALIEQREAISLAWYATAGSFAAARTGRAGDDPATFSDNPWTAPAEPGEATLWVVIRDDRGATAWRTLRVTVAP